jgi:Asp-tRNA(Asn)/Glu-tRNA(Gln) amidotransferase A subunit family amidase
MAADMTLADMAWAHAEQTRIFRRFQPSFRDYDLVLSPTVPKLARPTVDLKSIATHPPLQAATAEC